MGENLNYFGVLLLLVGSPLNADCYKAAQKLEAVYAKKENSDSRLLDKALKNYLCAAKDNNAAAAVRAVQLSRSGMVQQLPAEKEGELLEQVNKLGSGVAAHILAEDTCPNGMSNCQNILYAIDMLKVSVRRGDKDAPSLLGVIYQRGYGVPS